MNLRRLAWSSLLLGGCDPASSPEARYEVLAKGKNIGTIEVFPSPDGPRETVRLTLKESQPGLRVDATLPPPAQGVEWRWEQEALRRGHSVRVSLSETGSDWSSRVGLEIRRARGGPAPLPDGVHLVTTLPYETVWDQSPLALQTWLALAPSAPGETVTLSSYNLVEGRVEPGWISARERASLTLNELPIDATRYMAWTAAWGVEVWASSEGRLLAIDGPMNGLRVSLPGLGPLPQRAFSLPEGLIEEEVTLDTPEVRLAGTITRPRHAAGPLPGLLLVHGSGALDRDGDFGGVRHGILRLLAWEAAARGFAVLRWDKRGVGESKLHGEPPLTLDALADDARRWGDLLAARPDVRPDALFVAGHSEGGIIAPLVAADDPRFQGVVMLAGPAHRLDEIMAVQGGLILKAHGATQAQIDYLDRATAVSRKLMLLGKDRDIPGAPNAERSAAWLRSHMRHDPEATLRRVSAPLLAIYASLDVQVPPGEADELRRMSAALGRSGDTVTVVEGIDHLLMPVQKAPGMGEYADPDRRLEPKVLELFGGWLAARALEPAATE